MPLTLSTAHYQQMPIARFWTFFCRKQLLSPKKKNGPKDQNDGRADAKGRKQKVEQSVTKRSWLFHRNKHSYELTAKNARQRKGAVAEAAVDTIPTDDYEVAIKVVSSPEIDAPPPGIDGIVVDAISKNAISKNAISKNTISKNATSKNAVSKTLLR